MATIRKHCSEYSSEQGDRFDWYSTWEMEPCDVVDRRVVTEFLPFFLDAIDHSIRLLFTPRRETAIFREIAGNQSTP